jgi:hypothetical protein
MIPFLYPVYMIPFLYPVYMILLLHPVYMILLLYPVYTDPPPLHCIHDPTALPCILYILTFAPMRGIYLHLKLNWHLYVSKLRDIKKRFADISHRIFLHDCFTSTWSSSFTMCSISELWI